jgi:hypothetical protein
MKSLILIPHRFKIFGWIILLLNGLFEMYRRITSENPIPNIKIPFIHLDIHYSELGKLFTLEDQDINLTLVLTGWALGSLIVVCSKENIEDEFISNMRLNSLLWAFVLNNVFFILLTLTIYDRYYLMVFYWNAFSTSFLYIAIFHFILIKNSYYSDKNGK